MSGTASDGSGGEQRQAQGHDVPWAWGSAWWQQQPAGSGKWVRQPATDDAGNGSDGTSASDHGSVVPGWLLGARRLE